jgi:hypothetical protein
MTHHFRFNRKWRWNCVYLFIYYLGGIFGSKIISKKMAVFSMTHYFRLDRKWGWNCVYLSIYYLGGIFGSNITSKKMAVFSMTHPYPITPSLSHPYSYPPLSPSVYLFYPYPFWKPDQHPVILGQKFWKNFNYFFGTESKFFIMCLKEKIPRSRFLPFLNDSRFARATIVALCSQGLRASVLVTDLDMGVRWQSYFAGYIFPSVYRESFYTI